MAKLCRLHRDEAIDRCICWVLSTSSSRRLSVSKRFLEPHREYIRQLRMMLFYATLSGYLRRNAVYYYEDAFEMIAGYEVFGRMLHNIMLFESYAA